MRKCTVYKPTKDDWCPSYKMDGKPMVAVTFTTTGPNPPLEGEWRVCAWGGDDLGMERDFLDEREAWTCFIEIIGMETVDQDTLHEMGFTSA